MDSRLWLTTPTMTVSWPKGQGCSSCLVHEVGHLSRPRQLLNHEEVLVCRWNPKEVGTDTIKEMPKQPDKWISCLSGRVRATHKKAKPSSFQVFLCGLPSEGVARFKVGLPLSNNLIKKNPSSLERWLRG